MKAIKTEVLDVETKRTREGRVYRLAWIKITLEDGTTKVFSVALSGPDVDKVFGN